MLDLHRLFLFRQLALLGTISKVATSQGLTRPAVSQQLLKLEREIGAVLFERTRSGVRLTATGQVLVQRVDEVLALVEKIEAEIEERAGQIKGVVRIAAFGSATVGVLAPTMHVLKSDHPGVQLEVIELESPDGLRAAASKQVDLALVDDLMNRSTLMGSLQMLPLCEDEFYAVLPAHHRLAGADSLKLDALADEYWDLSGASQGYSLLLLSACRAQGFEPKIRSSCRSIAASLALVKAGDLVSVLPNLGLRSARADRGLRVVPLSPPIKRQVYVATVRESSRRPIVAAVLASLRTVARERHSER